MSDTPKKPEIDPTVFIKTMKSRSGATHRYTVTKPENVPWPFDRDLINFCDGGSANWGGKVSQNRNIAYVDVYVD